MKTLLTNLDKITKNESVSMLIVISLSLITLCITTPIIGGYLSNLIK